MNRIPHTWMISNLKKSHLILGAFIKDINQEQAQQLRDGSDGWNILEIICHVRDYQEIFYGRLKRILEEDNPTFKVYDEVAREAMITERDYANQNLKTVFEDYCKTRENLISFLSELEEKQWQRVGIHPMLGEVDISVPIFHTILHDADHSEQIARICG